MWRIHPEPIIALDGDTAGLRAAMRLIDLALPLLEAGQSLRFAIMPEGQDPDDLIQAQGAGRDAEAARRRDADGARCCGGARPRARCSTAPSAGRRSTATCAR